MTASIERVYYYSIKCNGATIEVSPSLESAKALASSLLKTHEHTEIIYMGTPAIAWRYDSESKEWMATNRN